MTIRRRKRGEAEPGRKGYPCGGWRWKGRTALCLVVCGLLSGGTPRAFSQSEGDGEYRLKLAFLYNFARFVEWPADAFPDESAPLTICVVGEDPFRGGIEQDLRGRTVAGHPINIRRLQAGDNPRTCQMVFVRAGEKRAAEKILPSLKASSTLSVGESKGFAERGGVINLTLEENKLHFEVNLGAAAETRLRISSKLLALAKIVKE